MTRLPQLLFGRGVFAPVHHIIEELPFEKVGERPAGIPHSIFEELWHLDYWQRYLLAQSRGERPAAEGAEWPGSPGPDGTDAWRELLESIRLGLDEGASIAADAEVIDRDLDGGHTVRGSMEELVAHNSYHWARVVVLRQLLGLWPPHGIG